MGCAFVFAYPRRTPIIIAIVVGSAFGLEALQLLTPDRHSRTIDALVKAAGGLGGIGIGRLALWALQKHSPYPTSVVQGEQSAN